MAKKAYFVLGCTGEFGLAWLLNLEPRTLEEARRSIYWQGEPRGLASRDDAAGEYRDSEGAVWNICTRTGPAEFRTLKGATLTALRGPYTGAVWREFVEQFTVLQCFDAAFPGMRHALDAELVRCMGDMPLESGCGDDCRRAIAAGAGFAEAQRMAWGDDGYPGRVSPYETARTVGEICGTFICG